MSRVVVAALLALGFVLTVASLIEARSAREKMREAQERADSAAARANYYQQRLDSVKRHEEPRIAELVTERDEAVARANAMADARPFVVDRVLEVAGDSAAVVEAVRELEAVHEQEIGALWDVLSAADSVIAAQRRTLDAYADANASLRDALRLRTQEAELWRKQSKPLISSKVALVGGVVLTLLVVGR